MNKRASTFCVILLTVAIKAASVWAHPFHVSFAEVEWNSKSNALEVALKVDPNDLETALRKKSGKRVKLEDRAAVPLMRDYVKRHFLVRLNDQKKPASLKWVGAEVSVKAAWLYFEIPARGDTSKITITNRILHSVPEQVNTLTFKQGKQQQARSFTAQQPTHTFPRSVK